MSGAQAADKYHTTTFEIGILIAQSAYITSTLIYSESKVDECRLTAADLSQSFSQPEFH